MFRPHNSDDLQAMLLCMAAAAAKVPDARAKVARMLRAALVLVEDEKPAAAHVVAASPATAKALEELAFSLSLATEHASFLAEQAALTRQPPQT